MFKIRLHFMFWILDYHVAAANRNIRKHNKHVEKFRVWIRRKDRLLTQK